MSLLSEIQELFHHRITDIGRAVPYCVTQPGSYIFDLCVG